MVAESLLVAVRTLCLPAPSLGPAARSGLRGPVAGGGQRRRKPTSFRLFVRDAGAPDGEIYYRRMLTDEKGHTLEEVACDPVADGYLSFDLPPFSSVLWVNEPAAGEKADA
jgi:hypothetical protein